MRRRHVGEGGLRREREDEEKGILLTKHISRHVQSLFV
jgi:hypothetical protein